MTPPVKARTGHGADERMGYEGLVPTTVASCVHGDHRCSSRGRAWLAHASNVINPAHGGACDDRRTGRPETIPTPGAFCLFPLNRAPSPWKIRLLWWIRNLRPVRFADAGTSCGWGW